jgi:imidazole glycerol-phosphate synthase subunit HisF
MLKKRIIPVELLHKGRLVKSIRFDAFRDVGDPLKSSQVYSDQDADELIVLNVDRDNRDPNETANFLQQISTKCFMPIAAGGGITKIEDASLLFQAGADKVVVNSAAFTNNKLLFEIVKRWGSQALVVSIDVSKNIGGNYVIKSNCGRVVEQTGLLDHIRSMVDVGAGEIMVNSIDNDGVMDGYDLSLIELVLTTCTIPLIVCGGAGHYIHLHDALNKRASAVACGSMFNFGDNNPLRAKAFLKNYNVPLKKI